MRELLAREQRRHIAQQNETLKIALTAFASEQPRTLDDLLANAELDWKLTSSPEQSDGPPPSAPSWEDQHLVTHELHTRDLEGVTIRRSSPPPDPRMPRPPSRR